MLKFMIWLGNQFHGYRFSNRLSLSSFCVCHYACLCVLPGFFRGMGGMIPCIIAYTIQTLINTK